MQVPVWVIKGWEEFVSLCRGVTEGGKWGKEKEAKENFPRLHSIYCFIPPPPPPPTRVNLFFVAFLSFSPLSVCSASCSDHCYSCVQINWGVSLRNWQLTNSILQKRHSSETLRLILDLCWQIPLRLSGMFARMRASVWVIHCIKGRVHLPGRRIAVLKKTHFIYLLKRVHFRADEGDGRAWCHNKKLKI